MFMKRFSLILSLSLLMPLAGLPQVASGTNTLVDGQLIERTIAGGESHPYQISLGAGQYVRVVANQRGMDVKLSLAGADGKVIESDMTGIIGAPESLAYEAPAAGTYQLLVRANGAATQNGAYDIRLDVKASAGPQDRKRITAESLFNEARQLSNQKKYTDPQLNEKLGKALGLFRELDDRFLQALALNLTAISHREGSKNNEKAFEAFEQALSLMREVKLREGEVTLLSNIGDANRDLERYEKALDYYKQVLTIRRELKDRDGERLVLTDLAKVYENLLQPDKEIDHYEQALVIDRELKNRSAEATTLNNIGSTHFSQSRFQKAKQFSEQALIVIRGTKDRRAEASILASLGRANRYLGDFENAFECYEKALVISREVKDPVSESATLSSLASVYRSLRRFDKAIEYLEEALEIARAGKNRRGEHDTLASMGFAYEESGRYEKAIEYHEQSLAIAREMKYETGVAYQLINLGVTYYASSRYEKAIEYYEKALVMARETKSRGFEANLLSNIAAVHFKLGRYEKAIGYYEQVLAIARELKIRAMEGTALLSLGLTYEDMGRHEKAIEYYESFLAIQRELRSNFGEAHALHVLARIQLKRGNFPHARIYIEDSLKLREAVRTSLMSPESRAQHSSRFLVANKFYAEVLMRQHHAEPTKGFDARAFETSEFQRARSLLDLLAEARADIRQGVDPVLLQRERTVGEQLAEKARLLTRAKPEQAAALRKEIGQLETEYERAQAAIRKASPHYAALTQPQPIKLNEIQAQLDADTVLLEYSLGEPDQEQSYLWAITRDSLTSYKLPKGEVIEKSAREVYELLTARSTNKKGETASQRQTRISQAEAKLPAAALELSKTILAPVAAQLGKKRLVIVADGALQYIPFAMLPDPAAGNNQPLVVGHEIVSLPSASTLLFQRKELDGRQPAPKMLAVIADPVFDRTDARFKTSDDKAVSQSGLLADTRGLEHIVDESATEDRFVIRRLPFTRQEADALLALTPKNSSFKAIDFQANRTNVLNGDLSQYKYVHFATHGVMDAQRPGLSSLVLSTVDADGKPQNGFLRANDIYNMKLPAELVVLSACQTGLGKEVKGEGLIGLTRGFMYAGARRVVVSLWSVNDKATSDLMTKFYQKMLKQGDRPAAALRAAQIEMWKQKQWQSPYYWAAFVMQGEWK